MTVLKQDSGTECDADDDDDAEGCRAGCEIVGVG